MTLAHLHNVMNTDRTKCKYTDVVSLVLELHMVATIHYASPLGHTKIQGDAHFL